MLSPDAYPLARRFRRAAHRAACARARPPSPTAGRWRATAPASSSVSAASSTTRRPATSAAPADWAEHGSYLRFCSNACAAWSNAALDAIGGFKPTLVSEETIAVAELLARGERIAYVAEAVVEHAHAHDVAGAFRRQFDVGYSRRIYDWLLLAGEGDEPRGRRFAAAVLRRCPARGAGRAAADRGPARGAAGSATASGWSGTACRAGSPGG